MATDVLLYGHFVASKAGKTGLADVTVDIDKIEKATGTRTAVVTAGAATEGRRGYYYYRLAAATPLTHDYVAVFMTADATVDQQQVAAVRPDLAEGWAAIFAYLDAAISTRLASASYTAAPSAGTVADAILDDEEVSTGVTVRQALAAAGSAADPLTNPASGYTEPQVGYYLQRLANNQVELVSVFDPVTMALRFRYGDDYAPEESRSQTFTTDLDLTGAAVAWNVRAAEIVTVDCDVLSANTYRLTVTAADLEDIGIGEWAYDLEITLANGHTVTEVAGTVTVTRDIR